MSDTFRRTFSAVFMSFVWSVVSAFSSFLFSSCCLAVSTCALALVVQRL